MITQEINDFLIFLEDEFKPLEIEMHGRIFEHRIEQNGKDIKSISFPHFIGEKQGIPMEIELLSENNDYFTPDIRIYFKLASTPFMLSLKKGNNGFLRTISKKLGLLQEIDSGIDNLDETLIIKSDSPKRVREFLRKKNVTQAILRLNGFSYLNFSDNSIEFYDCPFSEEKYSKDYFKNSIENLMIIALEYIGKNEIQ